LAKLASTKTKHVILLNLAAGIIWTCLSHVII